MVGEPGKLASQGSAETQEREYLVLQALLSVGPGGSSLSRPSPFGSDPHSQSTSQRRSLSWHPSTPGSCLHFAGGQTEVEGTLAYSKSEVTSGGIGISNQVQGAFQHAVWHLVLWLSFPLASEKTMLVPGL